MKTRNVSIMLVALVFSSASLQAATTSGTIRFTGLVFLPASASTVFNTPKQPEQGQASRIYPLREELATLHCDLLDYFAAYAAKDAKVVSMTYQ